jgi:glycosyltransferase involved in cell wall biosynthesis
MKILFLSRWYPFPADNGSRIRIYHLLKSLSTRHEISLISFTSETVSACRVEAMRQFCSRAENIPYRTFRPRSLKAIGAILSPKPRSVVDTHSQEFKFAAAEECDRFHPDVVIASQIDMAIYARSLPVAKRIFEEVEIGLLQDRTTKKQTAFQALRRRLMLGKYIAYLQQTMSSYSICTVVSEIERQRLIQTARSKTPIVVVPNGVELASPNRYDAALKMDTIIYAGALTYHANYSAVEYFLRDIFPIIKQRRPAAKFFVTGKHDGIDLNRLPKHDGVVFTGYVDDIRSKVASSWVSVVPLVEGGGTRLKVLESMALGTPVVSTSKGVEGFEIVSERDGIIADSAMAFAEGVIRVLESPTLRRSLSENGIRFAQAFDWKEIGAAFEKIVAAL